MIEQYIADAFTNSVFHGNPAAVCVLPHWPSDVLMQQITRENNLSETAFTVKEGERYHLRWFTPGGEIDLCGHATLATSFILSRFYEPQATRFRFATLSGELVVDKVGSRFRMDFPAFVLREIPVTEAMEKAFGVRPLKALLGRDLLCVLPTQEEVRSLKPNFDLVKELPGLLQHVTARGAVPYDSVSRSFGPKLAVNEDPVCGSGHCHIVPYWAGELGKSEITAYQASLRGGTLYCQMNGERVYLAGDAALFAKSTLQLDL